MKKVIVFFDLEGWWEAPYRGKFDLNKHVDRILKILDFYKVKAVFNTCGVVVEFFPDLVKKIHEKGHEIASHGYRHENFIQLPPDKLNKILKKTEGLIKGVTGSSPVGIRCPWVAHDDNVYSVIRSRGYKWVSDHYAPFPELFDNPCNVYPLVDVRKLAKLAVKLQHMFFYPKQPYYTGSLLQIPLLSSMDGDLLCLVAAEQKTPQYVLDFAFASLRKQFKESKTHFNLNFHPWLIGASNRTALLDNILSYIVKKDVKFILAKDLLK